MVHLLSTMYHRDASLPILQEILFSQEILLLLFLSGIKFVLEDNQYIHTKQKMVHFKV